MKTLKYIGMALFTAALSANFTACSSSDGDDNENIENRGNNGNKGNNNGESDIDFVQKYISVQKSKYIDQNHNNSESDRTFNVSYNNTLVTRIKCKKNNEIDEDWKIDYGGFLIIKDLGRISRTDPFVIGNNGCIATIMTSNSSYDATTQFLFDENRYLISQITETKYIGTLSNLSGTRTYKYMWQDGNLVKIEFTYQGGDNIADSGETYIEYGNLANKGKLVPPGFIYFYSIGDLSNIFMSCGMFGEVNKNLPTKVTHISRYHSIEYKEITNYRYELDEQGFVKSISSDAETGFINSSFTYKN